MLASLISAIIELLESLFYLLVDWTAVDNSKEIAEKPFVCPNCGKEFYKKWSQLYFHGFDPRLTNKARLKCPHCKERDACRWTGVNRVGNYE